MAEPQQWTVPLSDIEVDEEISRAVANTVASGWWSMGPCVVEFEQAFARFCGTTHALAVANGTAALHLALLACGIGAGDEVLLPSLNFVAAANTVKLVGATPVFCDVLGTHDLNVDPEDLEAAVGPATKAVLALHYGGFPCDLEAVVDVAERKGLLVIEDAAHAPGAMWRGRCCGTVGSIGCFSLFSNKNLPVGEGGMVVTNDDVLAGRMRLLRSHGMTTLTWDRHRGHASTYDVVVPGLNYRLDELRAAMGLVQLRRLDERNEARRRIALRYRQLLDGQSSIQMPFGRLHRDSRSAHHLAVIVLPENVDRDAVREALRGRGIQTSVHYPPIHRFSAYAKERTRRALPQTEEVGPRVLTLPLYPHLADEQVEYVATELLEALAGAPCRMAVS